TPRPHAAALVAVRPDHPELGQRGVAGAARLLERVVQCTQVLAMDALQDRIESLDRLARHHTEDAILPFVPGAFSTEQIPVPRAHAAGGERQAASPLAVLQAAGAGPQLRCA